MNRFTSTCPNVKVIVGSSEDSASLWHASKCARLIEFLKKKIIGTVTMYANYFYDTSVIFSNSIITYRETFTICIGHDRRTDVIGIDCCYTNVNSTRFEGSVSLICICRCVHTLSRALGRRQPRWERIGRPIWSVKEELYQIIGKVTDFLSLLLISRPGEHCPL